MDIELKYLILPLDDLRDIRSIYPSSIAPEQASPAYDRFPLVYCLEALDLHPVCPDLDNKAGRGVSQSLCYFHVTLYQFSLPLTGMFESSF